MGVDAIMCDKPKQFPEIPKPKSAYELLMAKQKREEITMWFTNDICTECKFPVYTNGKLYWCKRDCINNGKRGKGDRDGFGFINDLIR